MAKTGSSVLRILYDEFDLSGDLNSIGQNISQEVINARPFNSTAPDRVIDGYDWTWDFGGFGNYDENLVDQILQHDTSDHYCAWGQGYTAGNVWYFGPSVMSARPISASTGSAQGFTLALSGDEGLSRGVLLDTRTVSGIVTSTGQNLGATSAGTTFAAQVHVISGTFSDLDIEIQESSDDGGGDSYAAIAGFTQANISAAGVYRFTTTSATEAWKRVEVTGWTGTSALVHVVCGTVPGA